MDNMSSLTVYLTAVTSNSIVGREQKEEGHMSKGMAMLKSLGWAEGKPFFSYHNSPLFFILGCNSII